VSTEIAEGDEDMENSLQALLLFSMASQLSVISVLTRPQIFPTHCLS